MDGTQLTTRDLAGILGTKDRDTLFYFAQRYFTVFKLSVLAVICTSSFFSYYSKLIIDKSRTSWSAYGEVLSLRLTVC